MRHVRAVFRILSAVLLTIVLVVVWVAGNMILFWSRSRINRWRFVIMRVWGRGILWIMGCHFVVHGTPPEPPFCLVANHLGYMDIFVMAATVQARLVSRADLAQWPGIGWLAVRFGTLFIDRTRMRDIPRVAEQMRQVLDEQDGIVFFPEGTSSSGDTILPFRSPLLEVPAALHMPVHVAAISYGMAHGNARETVCWWGDMTFGDHLYNLLTKPGFSARIAFTDVPVTGHDRKLLAAHAHRVLENLYQTVRLDQAITP